MVVVVVVVIVDVGDGGGGSCGGGCRVLDENTMSAATHHAPSETGQTRQTYRSGQGTGSPIREGGGPPKTGIEAWSAENVRTLLRHLCPNFEQASSWAQFTAETK